VGRDSSVSKMRLGTGFVLRALLVDKEEELLLLEVSMSGRASV
jgi:hypothetical protein